MTTELDDYKPFEWLKGANVSVPSQGCYPKVWLKLNADGKAPVVVAVSPANTTTLDVLDRLLLPPEFYLEFVLSAEADPHVVNHSQLSAEAALIERLFPTALPQDLWISHRGGWDKSYSYLRDKNLYSILVSVVHVQPQ
jgi:hypothetical protein